MSLNWVALKELKPPYHNKEALLFTIYYNDGKLTEVP